MSGETLTLAEFLLARIIDDYETERGDAALDTAREFAARLKANMRRMALVLPNSDAWLRKQAARYADHPDFRPEWRVSPVAGSHQA